LVEIQLSHKRTSARGEQYHVDIKYLTFNVR